MKLLQLTAGVCMAAVAMAVPPELPGQTRPQEYP